MDTAAAKFLFSLPSLHSVLTTPHHTTFSNFPLFLHFLTNIRMLSVDHLYFSNLYSLSLRKRKNLLVTKGEKERNIGTHREKRYKRLDFGLKTERENQPRRPSSHILVSTIQIATKNNTKSPTHTCEFRIYLLLLLRRTFQFQIYLHKNSRRKGKKQPNDA